MDYGAHLPLIALDGQPWPLRRLLEYTRTAESLGFGTLSANDHLLFPRPLLDGPTALAAVLTVTKRVGLATTVALPTVRGLVPLARVLWRGEGPPFEGAFYSTEGITLELYPVQRPGPPI